MKRRNASKESTSEKGSRLTIPDFRSEAEEADWWYSHQDFIAEAFERGLKDGTLRWRPPSKSVSLRLSTEDLARARRVAERKGIGYQTLVKMLVHEGLNREEQAARGSARR